MGMISKKISAGSGIVDEAPSSDRHGVISRREI